MTRQILSNGTWIGEPNEVEDEVGNTCPHINDPLREKGFLSPKGPVSGLTPITPWLRQDLEVLLSLTKSQAPAKCVVRCR